MCSLIRSETSIGIVIDVGKAVTIIFDVDGNPVERTYQQNIFNRALKKGDQILASFQFTLLGDSHERV